MERDEELMAQILELDPSILHDISTKIDIAGFTREQIDHHFRILLDEGLIKGCLLEGLDRSDMGTVLCAGVTSEGREYLKKSRTHPLIKVAKIAIELPGTPTGKGLAGWWRWFFGGLGLVAMVGSVLKGC